MLSDRGMVMLLTIYSEDTILLLCAYAHRLVSLEDAEEIVQEVMLWLVGDRWD